MKFETELIKGKLIKRYKRFLADVELENGDVVTAHCANSGSMLSVKETGATVWLSPSNNPKRKLKFTWEIIEIEGHNVGINTGLPNKIVEEAILAGQIKELEGYGSLRREVKYGQNSRIDVLLEDDEKPKCYVEVKNVTLRRGDNADFPDSVTSRGAKHLRELGDMVEEGHRSVMFYLVQRPDCKVMDIARDIDPTYDEELKNALKRGVEVICYQCDVGIDEIKVTTPVPVAFL
ncbi:Sugar fermentation stimulation protein homolog [Candidatus Terasakiella magnetica]|uniref:Sugar fermentation stimulation protein homolog n=1 Tax=Candidatus Terasakiella magnetica TaxID=1867952 RepID=A0A1C3RJD4_9PROT|nr:DNA/RNA nuclease SfsA [Candidatus Terasakiella magnetica]SCA57378.1 Sugar fermentation stimulation protein homolog [Candidatus Terasakiella magnetica]